MLMPSGEVVSTIGTKGEPGEQIRWHCCCLHAERGVGCQQCDAEILGLRAFSEPAAMRADSWAWASPYEL